MSVSGPFGRRCPRIAADPQIGCARCTRAAWQRLRELAADPEALDDTFDEWERGALAAIGELAAAGRHVRKVPIDIEALAAWCGQEGKRLDSAARAAYVTHLLEGGTDDKAL